tara:strand:- start:53 stop:316 length:264 start_codon:yes stop_codon:yes gene_type:complete
MTDLYKDHVIISDIEKNTTEVVHISESGIEKLDFRIDSASRSTNKSFDSLGLFLSQTSLDASDFTPERQSTKTDRSKPRKSVRRLFK